MNTTMSTIITVTTIMSMYMNLSTNVENSKFCYNANISDGKVVEMEVYNKSGEALSANLKHLYTYDDEERLVMRETLKWNKSKMTWEKYDCLSYVYDNEGYTVERRFWNEAKNEYAQAKERSRYTVVMENVLAVDNYVLNQWNGSYEMGEKMLILTPDTEKLMAIYNN